MIKKLLTIINISTVIFAFMLFIDYITTLFSLEKSGVVVSHLGIVFDHQVLEQSISTTFSVDFKMLYYYILLIVSIIVFEIIIYAFKKRR